MQPLGGAGGAKDVGGAASVEQASIGRATAKTAKTELRVPDAPRGSIPALTTTTLSPVALEALAKNEHKSPHDVLGLHPVKHHNTTATAARALFPDAQEVTLVTVAPYSAAEPEGDRFRRTPMTRVHDNGVFETVVPLLKKNTKYHFEVKESDGFVHKVEDPYRFKPTIDEFQVHLFGEGTLEQTASLLGAREKTLDGVKGFAFTVWAPNARRISVVGEFNDWDPRRNPMRQLGSGLFEIFMPKVEAGQLYQFEVLQKDGAIVRKSDPAAKRTVMRPETSSVTHTSNYEWGDKAWMTARAGQKPLERPVSAYEVHLPSWKRGQRGEFLNYRQLADELVPYLQKQNFTHVELVGLAEHPFDGSWGYQVTGYYAPTARHGSPDDFKYFVDKMHAAGIGVLYDWVPGHFPKDAHALASFDGTNLFDHEDPRKGEHQDWGTRIFNYGRNEVRSFLLGSLTHMLDEYHLDGVRVDAVASMIYLDYSRKDGEWVPNELGGNHNLEAIEFLKQVNSVVGAKRPGVMKIAEESTAFPDVTGAAKTGGLGFDLKWNMGWMNDTLHWFERGYDDRKDLDPLTNTFNWAFSEKYVCALSHDEVTGGKRSLLEKMPGDDWQKFANLRLLFGWMWSYPGHKLLMMGQEFGQREEWNAEGALSFGSLENGRHQGAAALIADLNALYQKEPALHQDQFAQGSMEVQSRDPHNAAVAVLRKGRKPQDSILFLHNMTPNIRGEYRVGVDAPGTYREIMNTDLHKYGGSDVKNSAVKAEKIEWHGKPYSILVTLPPLGTIALKKVGAK